MAFKFNSNAEEIIVGSKKNYPGAPGALLSPDISRMTSCLLTQIHAWTTRRVPTSDS